MHKAFDLVLFDLDGTLVETAPEICDAVNDTLRRFDLPEATLEQVARWIGHGTRELLIQALASASGTDVATVRASSTLPLIAAEFDRHYAARCGTRSQPYPHVVDTLHTLRAQGVKLAVVTNKEGVYTRRVLDAHSLTPLFDRVVSGDSLPTKKPDPAGAKGCTPANSGQVMGIISLVALSFMVQEPSGIMLRSSARSLSDSARM